MLLTKEEILISSKIKTQGVYFLFFKDEIVYIGSSKDCDNRVKMHNKKGDMIFSRHSVIVMNDKTRNEVFYEEKKYIKKYNPKYNILNTKCLNHKNRKNKKSYKTFKVKILEKYGSVYAFAKEKGFSNQKAHYLANRDIEKMNQTTLGYMCSILNCDIKDL